mmetsp:Transcript_36404/g.102835  ORF Transcript_36404/g.102835 Transcript_36404/m.102835 type:complete len:480 (+) Transcript_36404:777-2216(+)
MSDSKRLQQKLSELSKRGLTTAEPPPQPLVRADHVKPRASKGSSNKPMHVDLYPPLPPHEPFRYNLNLHPGGGYDFPGAAIGKGGSIVREIRQQTGTWLVVCDEQGPLEGRRPPADANVYVRISAHDSSESGLKAVMQAAHKVAGLWQPINARFKPFSLAFGAAVRLEPDWDYLDQSADSAGASVSDTTPAAGLAVPPPPPPPKKAQRHHKQKQKQRSAWDLPQPQPLEIPMGGLNPAAGIKGHKQPGSSQSLHVSPQGGSSALDPSAESPPISSPGNNASPPAPPAIEHGEAGAGSFWPWDQGLQNQIPGVGGGHFQLWGGGGDHQALAATASSPLDGLPAQQPWTQPPYDQQLVAWGALTSAAARWGVSAAEQPAALNTQVVGLLPADVVAAPQEVLGLPLGFASEAWQAPPTQQQQGIGSSSGRNGAVPAAASSPWAISDAPLAEQEHVVTADNGSAAQDSSEAEVEGLLSLLTCS